MQPIAVGSKPVHLWGSSSAHGVQHCQCRQPGRLGPPDAHQPDGAHAPDALPAARHEGGRRGATSSTSPPSRPCTPTHPCARPHLLHPCVSGCMRKHSHGCCTSARGREAVSQSPAIRRWCTVLASLRPRAVKTPVTDLGALDYVCMALWQLAQCVSWHLGGARRRRTPRPSGACVAGSKALFAVRVPRTYHRTRLHIILGPPFRPRLEATIWRGPSDVQLCAGSECVRTQVCSFRHLRGSCCCIFSAGYTRCQHLQEPS